MQTITNIDKRSSRMLYWAIGLALLLIGTPLPAQDLTIRDITLSIAAGTTITTTGSIILMDSGAIENNGTIHVGGDWTNNGKGLIYNRTGTVVFNGTGPQTISGSAPTTFSNVTIDNASGVTVKRDAAIARLLTFTEGNIILDSSDITLQDLSTYQVIGAGVSSHIVTSSPGRRHRGDIDVHIHGDSIAARYLVPIGDLYAPLMFSVGNGAGRALKLGVYTEAGASPYENTPKPNAAGIDQLKRANQHWTISRRDTGSVTSYTVTFDFTSTENTGNTANYIVRKYNGASGWTTLPGTPVGNTITTTYAPSFEDHEFPDEFIIGEPGTPAGVREEQALQAIQADAYPNPTSGRVTVEFISSATGQYVARVTDVLGRTRLYTEGSAQIGLNADKLDLGNLARGVYMLNIEMKGQPAHVVRILVQ
jgi:hypothetical protein